MSGERGDVPSEVRHGGSSDAAKAIGSQTGAKRILRGAADEAGHYEDVLNAPENKVAEILDGELFLSRAAASRHAVWPRRGSAESSGHSTTTAGPGGWWILDEPELALRRGRPRPDLAGWRRDRMPAIADEAFFTLAARLGLRGPLPFHRAHRSTPQAADLRAGRCFVRLARRPGRAAGRGAAAPRRGVVDRWRSAATPRSCGSIRSEQSRLRWRVCGAIPSRPLPRRRGRTSSSVRVRRCSALGRSRPTAGHPRAGDGIALLLQGLGDQGLSCLS